MFALHDHAEFREYLYAERNAEIMQHGDEIEG